MIRQARAKFLANIQTEVKRLDRVLNDLLKLSRIETQPVAETDVCDVTAAGETSRRFTRNAPPASAVLFVPDIPDAPLRAKISAAQIQQVVGHPA